MKNLFNILLIFFCVFGSSILLADEKINLKNIHKLLQEKKFEESIQNLEILSDQNDINAQLLYSKILFSCVIYVVYRNGVGFYTFFTLKSSQV